MKNKILLIGGYRKTKTLAKSLLKKGYKVTVINDDHEQCNSLAEIDGIKVIHGDGTLPSVLSDAGAKSSQIAIALTSKDEDNLVACQLCKNRFGVKKTISLVGNPNKTQFFLKMGVDSAICAMEKITAIIEQQATVDKIKNIAAIAEGNIIISQIKIEPEFPAVEKTLREIQLPLQIIIGCILRAERSVIPHGNTVIHAGDTLILIAENGALEKAITVITGVNG